MLARRVPRLPTVLAVALSSGPLHAAPAPEPSVGTPTVTIEGHGRSDGALVLWRLNPVAGSKGRRDRQEAVQVCAEPCDQAVDGRGGHAFVVGGVGLVPSRSFRLAQERGPLTLRVRPGPRPLWWAGWIVGAVGLGAALAGFGAATIGDGEAARIGFGVTGAGAALLSAGVIMIAFGRTRVRVVGPNTRR